MNFKYGIIGTIAAIAISVPALASGTSSGSGSRGGGGFSGGSVSQPRDPAKVAYSRGHRLFKKRIACKKCEYPRGFSDNATASKVMSRVRNGEFKLKSKEREFVLYYLSDRYNIRSN